MTILRQALKNARSGLRAVHAIRAALLMREINKILK